MCVQNKRNVARSEPRNVLTTIRFVIEPPGSGSQESRTPKRNVELKNQHFRYRRCIPQTFANHQRLPEKFDDGCLGKLGWGFAAGIRTSGDIYIEVVCFLSFKWELSDGIELSSFCLHVFA